MVDIKVEGKTNYGSGEPYVTEQPHHHHEHIVNIQAAGSGRAWNHGICGCAGDCCKGCCCNICWACDVSHSMGEWSCVPYCCGQLGLAALRTKMRMALGIRGSLVGDICCTSLFFPCAVCQMHHELHHLGLFKAAEMKAQVDVAKDCLCE